MNYFLFAMLYVYMFSIGKTEGSSTGERIPDNQYHGWRTLTSFSVFTIILVASHFGDWVFSAWVGSNALYNRALVQEAQGSWEAVNDGEFDFYRVLFNSRFPFIYFKEKSYKYPWGMTGKSELYFTFPFFTFCAIVLVICT